MILGEWQEENLPGETGETDMYYLSTGRQPCDRVQIRIIGLFVFMIQSEKILAAGRRYCKCIQSLNLISGIMELEGRSKPSFYQSGCLYSDEKQQRNQQKTGFTQFFLGWSTQLSSVGIGGISSSESGASLEIGGFLSLGIGGFLRSGIDGVW